MPTECREHLCPQSKIEMTYQQNTVSYPAKFTRQENGSYSVTFRDVPEAITHGDTLYEANQMAAYALTTVFEYYREYVKPIPTPSPVMDDEVLIAVKRP